MSTAMWALAALFLLSGVSWAEPSRVTRSRPPAVDVSPRALVGFNFSYGAANPAQPGGTRNAPSLLAAFDFGLANGWSLCPGLGLLARGVQTTVFSYKNVDLKGMVHLDYLEVPILLKKAIAVGSRGLQFTLFGGPAVAVALQRQIEMLGAVDWDLSSRFFSTDALVYFGAGLEYRSKTGPGFIGELRYALGLGDIDKSPHEYRTRGILLLLGLSY